MISYHHVQFGGHKHCGSGDMMFLTFYVISRNSATKEPCDLGSLILSTHSFKLCGHRHCCNGDIMNLVCHVVSQGFVVQEWCGFMASSPLR